MILERRCEIHVVALLSKTDASREQLPRKDRTRRLHSGVALEHVLEGVYLIKVHALLAHLTVVHSQRVGQQARSRLDRGGPSLASLAQTGARSHGAILPTLVWLVHSYQGLAVLDSGVYVDMVWTQSRRQAKTATIS